MECLGPQCAAMLLEWLQKRSAEANHADDASSPIGPRQSMLWNASPYVEDAPAIGSSAELAGAIEHLDYAVYRRFENTLTRAERIRLDNTIQNALYKIDRYAERLSGDERACVEHHAQAIRDKLNA